MNATRVNTIGVLLQNLRTTFNERLKVIEDILDAQTNDVASESGGFAEVIEGLEARIRQLETAAPVNVWASPPIGLEVLNKAVTAAAPIVNVSKVAAEEVEAQEEEVEEEEDAQEEDVQEEEAEPDFEEPDAVSLTPFTHRGREYYRDPDNTVYTVDADGELMDDPIGTWDEARQKILKLATA
jgi:hypothetical protein